MTRQETPEKAARRRIDEALEAAGWKVQYANAVNLHAGRGVAIREFKLNPGHGYADYLLYVDGKATGVIEAKREGETLTGVEAQAEKYATGLPVGLPAQFRPLPFLYQSTGIETRFYPEQPLDLFVGESLKDAVLHLQPGKFEPVSEVPFGVRPQTEGIQRLDPRVARDWFDASLPKRDDELLQGRLGKRR